MLDFEINVCAVLCLCGNYRTFAVMDLAEKIKARRERLGLTQAQLAALSGKSITQIADIEQRRQQIKGRISSPSISTLEPIIQALRGRLDILWDD